MKSKVPKGWITQPASEHNGRVHIYPQNDEREHDDLFGLECWCNPSYDYPVVTHNSADMRELIEQAEVIKASMSEKSGNFPPQAKRKNAPRWKE